MLTYLQKELRAWEAIVAACLRDDKADESAYLERARRTAEHYRRAIGRD